MITTRWFPLALVTLLVCLTLLACGPTAQPEGGGSDILASEPGPGTPLPPKPTPTPEPVLPTKPPLPKTPEPTYQPLPAHPDGFEGCKTFGMITAMFDSGEMEYFRWCAEQISQEVEGACSGLDTAEAQLACGVAFVSGFDSVFVREGPYKCFAIGDEWRREREQCLEQLAEESDKAYSGLYEGWEKVRIGGDAAPEVALARKDTVDCLEVRGYKDVDPDLLFYWQRFERPLDHKARVDAQTQEQKDLEKELLRPTWDCAKEHGLFEAQDEAWLNELVRLSKDEPETVDVLIREGMLEALRKPGISELLTGGTPPGE